jgi:hypothetical protein
LLNDAEDGRLHGLRYLHHLVNARRKVHR